MHQNRMLQKIMMMVTKFRILLFVFISFTVRAYSKDDSVSYITSKCRGNSNEEIKSIVTKLIDNNYSNFDVVSVISGQNPEVKHYQINDSFIIFNSYWVDTLDSLSLNKRFKFRYKFKINIDTNFFCYQIQPNRFEFGNDGYYDNDIYFFKKHKLLAKLSFYLVSRETKYLPITKGTQPYINMLLELENTVNCNALKKSNE